MSTPNTVIHLFRCSFVSLCIGKFILYLQYVIRAESAESDHVRRMLAVHLNKSHHTNDYATCSLIEIMPTCPDGWLECCSFDNNLNQRHGENLSLYLCFFFFFFLCLLNLKAFFFITCWSVVLCHYYNRLNVGTSKFDPSSTSADVLITVKRGDHTPVQPCVITM